jgi:Raf kinase inhibitor-like YbhB/YbcL family protein
MRITSALTALTATVALSQLSACGGSEAMAQTPTFTLSSPDLASGTFSHKFIAKGFGCSGDNVSPALDWRNAPAGTKSFALMMYDPDAPTGSGFWHWTVYNIPASATSLAQGVGNAASKLPAPAFGGTNDFQDTGVTGVNGNYGGPCPPSGDAAHRYVFTLYALAVDDVPAAAGVPKTGTAALYGFVLNKGLGANLLGKASFTATYGR